MVLGACKYCKHRWYSKKNGVIRLWCLAKGKELDSAPQFCLNYEDAKGYDKHTLEVLEDILRKEEKK